MYNLYSLTSDIVWVGASDRRLERFENMIPLPTGVSYNSYLIKDEQTALLDTVDAGVSGQHIENVINALEGRKLDYLIINHMEPDHCANIEALALLYPNMEIVGNTKTFQLLEQFYKTDHKSRYMLVKDKDELSLGKHNLQFIFTPMVHWPEVMMCYESSQEILFTADAFGSFGALSGNIFDDQLNFQEVYLDEARRYYANIVGKYGPSVQMALKKVTLSPIKMIASLHGPVLRGEIELMLEKYNMWSSYTPEKQGVVIAYASMYGNTASAADALAVFLAERGVEDIRVYDVSKTHPSYIVSEAWKYSNIVFACPTYNLGIFYPMDSLIRELAALNLQNRRYSIIGNGSWAPHAGKKMAELLAEMKDMELVGKPLEIVSTLSDSQLDDMKSLADDIASSLEK